MRYRPAMSRARSVRRHLAAGLAVATGLAGCAHRSSPRAVSAPLELRVVAFNDFHGHLEPVEGADGAIGGAAYLAAHVARLRSEAEHAIVVSAGDLIGASPLVSALFQDEPTVLAMNRMGLDLNAVGNHELDEGLGELLRVVEGGCHPDRGCFDEGGYPGARFPFLGANTFDRRTGRAVFPPYAVRRFGGIDVAFIGLTLERTADVLPPVVPELRFEDEADVANRCVEALRARGVRAFVLLLHEGGFQRSEDPNACEGLSGPVVDIVDRLDPDVDLVVSGHTHRSYVCRRGERLLTSAGSNGQLVSDIRLELDRRTGDVVGARAENQVVDHRLVPVEGVAELVELYAARAAPKAQRVVARLRAALTRRRTSGGVSSLGRVIADAQLAATRALGAELALMNSGGIRAPVAPAPDRSGVGAVTYGMVFRAQPFQNLLVTLDLSGQRLLEVLEAQFRGSRPRFLDASSNLTYAWRADDTPHVLAETVRVDGEPLDPRRTYRVTVNSYMAAKDPYASGGRAAVGPLDLDALVDYLASAPQPFAPPPLDGVQRTD